MEENEHKGWHSRKGLPHYDVGGLTQFITFRLFDSLPKEFLNELKEEMKLSKGNIEKERYEKIQKQLDQGSGSCILREAQCAQIVQDSLKFLDGVKYQLDAWVVMPNHVHFLARFHHGQLMSKAMHSLKSFTGHEIKKLHPELEGIWQIESYDRYIRNEEHYWNTLRYIHNNPVESRICKTAEQFRWSSAYQGSN